MPYIIEVKVREFNYYLRTIHDRYSGSKVTLEGLQQNAQRFNSKESADEFALSESDHPYKLIPVIK